MRVAVIGATGVLGRAAIPALSGSYEVCGLARNPPDGVPHHSHLDLLDRDAVAAFARDWRPDVFVHLATAIPQRLKPWGVEGQFEATNRLRTEGTRNLIAVGEEIGGVRLVAQSIAFAGVPGPGLADEEVPLWVDGPLGGAAGAIAELERLTIAAGGAVLRFGQLVGAGTIFAVDGALGEAAGRGLLPIIHRGGRESTFSFTHPEDAATAIGAAIERDVAGIFNVVDDEPATTSEWIPELARARGAKRKPRRIPAAVARPIAGAYSVAFMTALRGASNAKAKRDLGWEPTIDWRAGFAEG